VTQEFIEYQFPFRGKILKMAGRPRVESDQAIIGMVFQREMFAMGHWEQTKALNRYYLENCNKGLRPLLIDAGANIGAASLYFNEIYPGMKTIAIEPDKANAALAQHNLASLDADIVQGALGKKTGTMFINDIDFGPIAYRVGETGNKAVDCHTIPSVLSNVAPGHFPFILKIDIEGGEDIVFSEDTPWLDLFPLVIIELHDWMLPFKNSSKNFYRNISTLSFDVLCQGENTFCYNSRILNN
jgi:FkbM family methyltransferase